MLNYIKKNKTSFFNKKTLKSNSSIIVQSLLITLVAGLITSVLLLNYIASELGGKFEWLK